MFKPLALMVFLLTGLAPLAGQDDVCLDCHETDLTGSIHEQFDCQSCHVDLDLEEHTEEGLIPDFSLADACGGCHEEEWDQHAQSVHGLKLNSTHPDEATCVDCHGGHEALPATDLASMVHPSNLVTTCGRCHSNPELVERHAIAIRDPITRYRQSIHFRVLESSGYLSATCNDCHGTHDIQNLKHSRSTINYWNVAETCGRCHTTEYEEFRTSDHWVALQRGVRDAPACISCHGEHAISDPNGRYDEVTKSEAADRTCLKCHSDDELADKYDLPANVAATYRDSYHGLAAQRGAEDVSTCYDCHGVHAILGDEHRASTIHPDNLRQTCAKCHEGATAQFAQAYTHRSVMFKEVAIEDIVKYIYLALIVVVIGLMVLHNAIIIIGYLRRKRRLEAAENGDSQRRFSRIEVWQHSLMLISFFTLVITGFALKFPEAGWVQLLAGLGLTETARGLIHRVAAVVMIGVSLWHLAYAITSRWGRHHLRQMLPRASDISDFSGYMKAQIAGRKSKVKFPLFDYTEKVEYWALVWGTLVMILTGLVLWFPTFLGEATPAWSIKVSEAVHYWEAWLATLAIFVWHIFFTVYHPDEYPLNNVMFFSGRMPGRIWRHRHAGFWEDLEKELAGYRDGRLTLEELTPFARQALEEKNDTQN